MQRINKNPIQSSRQHLEPVQRIFSKQEQESVKCFYGHLKAIYQGAYDNHFRNDERLIKASKREWVDHISSYSEEQIEKGVAWIKEQKVNHEDGWQYFDVGRCVGAIKQANTVKAYHQIYDKSKALPELPASKEFSKGQIANLKGVVA